MCFLVNKGCSNRRRVEGGAPSSAPQAKKIFGPYTRFTKKCAPPGDPPRAPLPGTIMPVLRTENIHNVVCKFYDGGVVKVGTAGDRFTIRVPAEEELWFGTRLRAELIRRELAMAEELPIDEAGEAAMASNAAAKARAAASKAALKLVKDAAAAKAEAESALAGAEYDVAKAELKRGRAELKLNDATFKAKVAKLVPVVSHLAQQTPEAAPLQAKMESFFRRPVG